nr:Ig-like domain-containing protein [Candidatus Margulisiibacteriota bacterium]
MKRSLLLITIGWLLAVTATAAPPFYSHYWVEGSVSEEGVPSARRQVEVYKTPDNKITGLTDASGRYQINLYDLEYFRGVPVTYESESYTVVVPATEGGLGGSESVLLRSVRGFVTTIFSFFRPGSGDVTPPRVTAFEPHGSNVSPSEVIRITFSELMSQEVTEKAISLRPLTGVYYEWQHVGDGDRPYSELYLLPVTSWQPGKSYLVTIGTGAADRAGNRMTEPETRSFTTLYGKGIDRVRPVIIATSPRDGDREVSLRTSVAILFSEAMSKEATVRAVSLPVKGAPWRANWIGSKLIFTPGQMLDLNALYEFTVSALACDLAGNRLAEDRHFTFRTLTAPPDVTPPTVISVSGGMNVALRPYIGIVFSEAMAPATINEVQLRLLDPGGNQVACDINYEAEINTAYLLPQADLLSYSGYTVVVRTGVTDLWENHLEREYRTTFVTADTAGPAIEKVKFDGRGYVENDVIASDALVSAEVTDSVGVNYNYLKLKLG